MSKGLALDSSAILAILFGESEQSVFLDLIFESEDRRVSAFTVLEAGAVILARKGPPGRLIFDSLCDELGLEIEPFSAAQARLARQAWERFGKGRHPAGLNLGDCCSYALARSMGYALLCKGNDFPRTDLELARY
ncbi:MAG: ribonuclease VapC [Acidobacteriota bacterium]|nr:ribonuclease VapC [Acidobacteriota bacterium]